VPYRSHTSRPHPTQCRSILAHDLCLPETEIPATPLISSRFFYHTNTRPISAAELLGRPERQFPDGLMFYRRCIFFSPRDLRGPSTDHPETLPHGRNMAILYNPTPKIRGALPPPPKKMGAKNMQNFGQFWTTSDFDRQYLRNG